MNSKRLILTILLLTTIFPAMSVYAQNTGVQESRRAKLQKEIELIDKQLKQNASKSKSALSELGLIRKKISNRNELIAESDKEIRTLNIKISEKKKEINALQARIDTLSDYYSKLVKRAYINRDSKVWYMYILASENIGQAFRRIGYLRSISDRMNVQAKKIKEIKSELEAVQESLINLKADALSVKEQRLKEVNALKIEERASKSIIDKLKRDKAGYQKDLYAKRRQVDALNREIARIICETTKSTSGKAGSGTSGRKPAIDYTLDKEFANNKGKLPWPAEGPVIERFGQHNHPVFTKVKLPFNNGISIALHQGTTVKAVFNGVVKQIVVMPGYNQCVLVQHGNYFSFYCKLDNTYVRAGDKVKTGDAIGSVTTIDGTSQLHFQIWKGTSPQNPENWLR